LEAKTQPFADETSPEDVLQRLVGSESSGLGRSKAKDMFLLKGVWFVVWMFDLWHQGASKDLL